MCPAELQDARKQWHLFVTLCKFDVASNSRYKTFFHIVVIIVFIVALVGIAVSKFAATNKENDQGVFSVLRAWTSDEEMSQIFLGNAG